MHKYTCVYSEYKKYSYNKVFIKKALFAEYKY